MPLTSTVGTSPKLLKATSSPFKVFPKITQREVKNTLLPCFLRHSIHSLNEGICTEFYILLLLNLLKNIMKQREITDRLAAETEKAF